MILRRRALLVLLLLSSACLWRSYETILAIHLDVLTKTADKLSSIAASGRGATSEGMAEYTYPAKRARQFLQQFANRNQRASYQGLTAFLDRYEKMVAAVDATRGSGQVDIAALKLETAALRIASLTINEQAVGGN